MEKKILIVDDAAPVRELLAKSFLKMGMAVKQAKDARDALNLLKKESFHVMFVDLNMPGMSGVEFCEQIRKDHPLSFIYAMTAYVSVFALTECREAGFDDYFVKPVNLKLFQDAVDAAFEKIDRWGKKSP